MKTKLILSAVVGAASLVGIASSHAQLIFTDDFNRANVAATGNGTDIGANYVITGLSGTPLFQITSNQLAAGGGTASGPTLSYQGFALQNDDPGDSFTVSADITSLSSHSASLAYGLVFNFQDANNYYVARFHNGSSLGSGALQFVEYASGTPALINQIGSLSVGTSSIYSLSVSSDTVGSFDYSLSGSSVNISGTWTDSSSPLSGGYAGLWNGNNNATPKFDNFSVTTIPEPSSAAMLGLGVLALLAARRRKLS